MTASSSPGRFEGQTAVVTGGASGIGRAITERLLADGARVSVWDRQAPGFEHPRLSHQIADVTSAESLAAARNGVLAETGRLDILVASAGITGPNITVEAYPAEEWRRVMEVNLTGVFLSAQAVIAPMRAQDYGRMVFIASVAGKEGNPNASAYSASKAGVIALTKSLGKELAETGIRVNCVTPAVIKTPLFAQMTQTHIDWMLSKIPMKRFGEVEEVAAMVCWLASRECSFSTAAVFDLSGGRATY